MKLQKLESTYSICKIPNLNEISLKELGENFFLSKTDEEISLVCESSHVPSKATAAEHGWRALKIAGVLDFGMVGIIAGISNILARASISVFVVSTYNTDYLFVKELYIEKSISLLESNGYHISNELNPKRSAVTIL